MKKIYYTCQLLTDVVLSSTAATEGNSAPLDYIPGSKFLGVVAKKLYNPDDRKTLDIFHNGTVRFGDAHLAVDGERSYKVPASWFYEKGKGVTDKIYLHHLLNRQELEELVKQGKQLKQARHNYFTEDTKLLLNQAKDFSIKTAHDRDKKRSKESQMFGYSSLKRGTKWKFYVEYDDESYINDVEQALLGKKRIGRSRSAQYGLVNIEKDKEESIKYQEVSAGNVVVYAESNLCFYDENGHNILQPDFQALNFPAEAQILWNKSQIRSRIYQTWNRQRYNRDADRQIIEKGSVFIVNTDFPISTENFIKGVGSHLSEGFGKVLINPEFLNGNSAILPWTLNKHDVQIQNYSNQLTVQKGDSDEILLNHLQRQDDNYKKVNEIDQKVNKFAETYYGDFKEVSPSQWGVIRKIAKYSVNLETMERLIFSEKDGYLHHGQMESVWRKMGRRETLKKAVEQTDYKIEFIIKLAAVMAKMKNK